MDVNLSVTLYLLQTYPSGKPLFKGQVLLNLHSNSTVLEESTVGIYEKIKKVDYKQLNETGEKLEKEKLKVTKLKLYQSCSEPYQSVKICNPSTWRKDRQAQNRCFSNR